MDNFKLIKYVMSIIQAMHISLLHTHPHPHIYDVQIHV